MKNLFIAIGIVTAFLASPVSANPILLALNEQPKCMKDVGNSNALHIKSYKKVGSNGVRMTIRKNKKAKPSSAVFNEAKAAFTACMEHRLDAHSVVVK